MDGLPALELWDLIVSVLGNVSRVSDRSGQPDNDVHTLCKTLRNNVDWDCFKTLTSQEILKIQNLLRVEHCAFWEVIRLFRKVGCVRNKLEFRTVQQSQKSFLWMQD